MKRTALTATMTMALALANPAFAGHNTPAAGRTVTACLDGPLGPAYAIVPSTTASMFARIGVKLEWHDANHCPSGALQIGFSTSTPPDLLPGALAYALPYEGTHIVVFLDRVRQMVEPRTVPALLAHVFAHEITHILQGCSRHSESGVMKARWAAADYKDMSWEPLPFASEDIELIYAGLAGRSSR